MPETAEVHAVQTQAFPCPASGGEKSVLVVERGIRDTKKKTAYSRLHPTEVG